MLKPTNDPIDAHRRDLALAARKIREAEAAGGTQPYQAVRKLRAALEELAAVVQSVVEQQAVLQQVQQQQAAIIASIPITRTGQGSGGGFSPGGWNTVASTIVERPAGKNNVNIFGSGQVQVNFSTQVTDTATWPFLVARLIIDGVAGPEFGLSTSVNAAGGNSVTGQCRGTVNYARSRSGSGVAQVQVQVAISGWANGSAPTSWSNQSADVSAICNFEQ